MEHEPCFDQGSLGSCTANAAIGCLVCEPFWRPDTSFTETDCVTLYELETRLDDAQVPGHYPPDDTGSTGVWSMQALEQQRRIVDFRTATTAMQVLQLLMDGPVSIGVRWYRSMFRPDGSNRIVVDPRSGIAGGHEVCLVGCDAGGQTVRVRNSWGTGWADGGHADLGWGELDVLMSLGGDAVQPVVA